jgi:conjugative transfer signal peptidase TraF
MAEAPERLPVALLAAAGLAAASTLFLRPDPVLVWNASPSSPVGLYAVSHAERFRTGEFVIARLPAAIGRLAAHRHYLPAGTFLVKRVAAASGAQVCASGGTIAIDGRKVATRLARDRAGLPLPWWSGCRRLHGGEVFLLNPNVRDSFDGRYFGVTGAGDIVGKGIFLWPR